MRLFEREIVSIPLVHVHSAKLLKLLRVLVHVGVVELLIGREKDGLGLFHAGISLVSLLLLTLFLLEVPKTWVKARKIFIVISYISMRFLLKSQQLIEQKVSH